MTTSTDFISTISGFSSYITWKFSFSSFSIKILLWFISVTFIVLEGMNALFPKYSYSSSNNNFYFEQEIFLNESKKHCMKNNIFVKKLFVNIIFSWFSTIERKYHIFCKTKIKENIIFFVISDIFKPALSIDGTIIRNKWFNN